MWYWTQIICVYVFDYLFKSYCFEIYYQIETIHKVSDYSCNVRMAYVDMVLPSSLLGGKSGFVSLHFWQFKLGLYAVLLMSHFSDLLQLLFWYLSCDRWFKKADSS